ncbi:MAG: hypothetical protein A2939_02100 [Parcubacteria group bacterium RIFCSPLOWO2_01_FULL_48_18]|nr:MAG: hypothetical protein A3J67_04775 [Parcubacteria group bacterium RIFCSPHIGHO2_02_FULL_48_10b]OHB22684.1 MAG: hypothetical protein A2939_02100 [Parcubacteria group bacterium RIFCSPLOWO2_01_FULL_48_18]
MKLFSSSKEKVDAAAPGYEEREKKTPIVGYILLLAMFIISLWLGWQALDDLASIPKRPETLSRCADEFINQFEFLSRKYAYQHRDIYYEPPIEKYSPGAPIPAEYPGIRQTEEPPCNFSLYETGRGIHTRFDKKRSLEKEIAHTQEDSAKTRTFLDATNQEIAALERQYGIGLLEKIVQGEGAFVDPVIREKVVSLGQQKEKLQNELSSSAGALEIAQSELKTANAGLLELYKDLSAEYDRAWKWHDFWVFLLQFLAAGPFFFVAFKYYLRLHRIDSPYTIILTALVAVASVLLVRVTLTWFWSLFLAELWQWIKNSAFLRSMVFYLGMLFSIAVFGGAVWFLQKKIFDPRRLSLRRMRNKECPVCRASLDLAKEYCPNCGTKISERCPSCGKDKFAALAHCPYCGK